MVWFDEGLAEYLVGATEHGEVTERSVLRTSIESEPAKHRMTLTEILNSSYMDGFRFYPYAAQVFAFLHQGFGPPKHLTKIIEAIRNGSSDTLKTAVDQLASYDKEHQIANQY